MNESQISVRYARALFRSASEKQVGERVYRDMELLYDTCRIKDFRNMLVMPSLQASQKYKLAESILGTHLSELSMSMINLVIMNKRETYLQGIARNYRDFYRKTKKISKATLVTAREANDAIRKKIMDLIAKAYESDVELSARVDGDLIGGFILTIEDRQYNASVANSLEKIKNQLLNTDTKKN